MTEQQIIWISALSLLLVFILYRKHKLGRNKVNVKGMLQQGAKVVDVRSAGEFAGGHYKGAINIPLDALSSRLNTLGDKSKPVIVYCASGMRSGSAKRVLESAGFTQVENGVNQGYLESL
ncbi:MAG TPA: rhodanese-like domain-containing protein [Turneriella sp.]|nr:rhodanese-like domain-containing protein [Turneriella sp.]